MLSWSIILSTQKGQTIMSNFNKQNESQDKQQHQSASIDEKAQQLKNQDQQKHTEVKPSNAPSKEHSEDTVKK